MILQGAIPATVGVLDGRVHIGLNDDQIGELCEPGGEVGVAPRAKVSRRDLPLALMPGRRCRGGTTVCGTLAAAAAADWAPPPLFVTGGVGGVHRGGETSMDVSADLVEMGRSRTAVICAGIKSILDVRRTLEVLETHGVAVAALGQEDFPAFFSRSSGCRSPHVVHSVEEAAEMIRLHRELGPGSGLLLAVPIPVEAAADGKEVEEAIRAALAEAGEEGVAGRDVTPFVLERVRRSTGGKSLKANLALIKNNADVGARIAVELARQCEGRRSKGRLHFMSGARTSSSALHSLDKRPLVIGGSILDLATTVRDPVTLDGSTHRGRVELSFGGVGRNLADALACFGTHPYFVSAVGRDDLGEKLLAHNPAMDKGGVMVLKDAATAVYNALVDRKGELVMGVGDMRIHARIDEDVIDAAFQGVGKPAAIVMDGNLTEEAIEHVLRTCADTRFSQLHAHH